MTRTKRTERAYMVQLNGRLDPAGLAKLPRPSLPDRPVAKGTAKSYGHSADPTHCVRFLHAHGYLTDAEVQRVAKRIRKAKPSKPSEAPIQAKCAHCYRRLLEDEKSVGLCDTCVSAEMFEELLEGPR